MLIVMKSGAAEQEIADVVKVIEQLGYRPHVMPGATRTAIGITGNPGAVDPARFENMAGVAEAIRVSKPYKLITLDLRPDKTVVRVGDATIGGDELAVIAGPCAIENRAQAFAVAKTVHHRAARQFFPWRKALPSGAVRLIPGSARKASRSWRKCGSNSD